MCCDARKADSVDSADFESLKSKGETAFDPMIRA
jgi:hypothetical protein